MPQKIEDLPAGWTAPVPTKGRSYEIELITPMVGGGASPGEVDLGYPIRASAIRGHLRHWWRLTCGSALGQDMWRREEEVFGSTEFPSPVTVSVQPLTDPRILEIGGVSPSSTRGYVLFPSIDKQQNLLDVGFRFQIDVQCCTASELHQRRSVQNRGRKPNEQLPPSVNPIDEELDSAIKAWLLFGGIGARTRRGCGSLRAVKESTPTILGTPVTELLRESLRRTSAEFRIFQAKSQQPHLQAWESGIELLKRFRQSVPRDRQAPRKKFPEAETLRRIRRWRNPRGRVITEEEIPSGFPRAELGLPIVFHFKSGTGPEDMIVLPTGRDGKDNPLQRMSSPLILKPIPISEKQSVATVIVIHRPTLRTIDVAPSKDQVRGRETMSYPVTDLRLATYPNSPLSGSASGSAIEAFLAFVLSQGFKEVGR